MSRGRRDDPPLRFEWERVVKAVRLPSPVKHVGLTLATYGNLDGADIRPGVDLLVDDTGLSDATVRRALKRLRELALIVRVSEGSRGGRRALADVYRLNVPPNLLEWVELVRSPVTRTADTGRDHRSHVPVMPSDHRSHVPGSPVPLTGSPVPLTRITGTSDTPPEHDHLTDHHTDHTSAHVLDVSTDRARANGRPERRTR